MKYLTITLALLAGCVTAPQKAPTPFNVETSFSIAPVAGCVQLRKEVEEYNKNHTDKKVADC